MNSKEKEALQERIDELQARLDEQVNVPMHHTIALGDVYLGGNGQDVLITGEPTFLDRGVDLTNSGYRKIGYLKGKASFYATHHGFLGTFEELYVRRDKIQAELEAKFLTMKDSLKDSVKRCSGTNTSYLIICSHLKVFIKNS